MKTVAPDEELSRRLVWLTLARIAVALVLLAVVMVSGGAVGGSPTVHGVTAVVLALLGASIPYAVQISRKRDLRTLAGIQIAIDLAAWTALVYVTGGPSSPLGFFFGLSGLTAALVLGERAARTTAVLGVAIYGTLTVAMTSNVLAPMSDQAQRAPQALSEVAFQLVSNVMGILVVAALGGSLASRLSRAGGALQRVEASREALAALYEDVLRSIPVGLLTCDSSSTIDGANEVASMLFGVPVGSMLGTPVRQWLPMLPDVAFAPNQPVVDGDTTLKGAPNSPRVAFHAATLYDRRDKPRGGLVIIEDRSHAEELRAAVTRAERFAELGRLAAALAHEIRNPLGAISGCVELVREAQGIAIEDRELLRTVQREVERLNDLVTDMLSFAKPRSPESVRVDLAALARDVVQLAGREGRGASVAWLGDAVDCEVSVDTGQVRQLTWNLIRNAVQASPEHSVVEVTVAASGDGAELSVSDRGPGIADDIREHLFDAFSTGRARGTGLGLAIVKQIADAHGATVRIDSRDGGGTIFRVWFPTRGSDAPTDKRARPLSAPVAVNERL